MRELGRQRQDVEGKSADEVAVEKVRGREKSVGDDRWRPHVSEGGKSSDDTGSCMPVKKPPHKPILIIRGQIYPVC